jgi:hypothetical protein
MTAPRERPGDEIRVGDRVKLRGTGQEGDVVEVLPAGAAMIGAWEDAVSSAVPRVKWNGQKKPVPVPITDLIKLA